MYSWIARGSSIITKSITLLYRKTRPPSFNALAIEAETVLKLSCFINARECDIAREPLNVANIIVNGEVNG